MEQRNRLHVAEALIEALDAPIRRALRAHKAGPAAAAVMQVLRTQTAAVLARELANAMPETALSTAELKPEQVLAEGRVALSLSQLYRATDEGRFYAIHPPGRRNGRLYPAWQFAATALPLLPATLALLVRIDPARVHARLVSSADALAELAPAEVLAGLPFATRAALSESQRALLALPSGEREARVHEALRAAATRHVAIG